MSKNNLAIAEAYYTEVGKKNIGFVEQHLHPDAVLITPMATVHGKSAIVEATKNFTNMFKTLKIRSKFGGEDQAVIIYDLDSLVGHISSSSLMTFKDGLVTKIELFYDARPFVTKKEEIFGQK